MQAHGFHRTKAYGVETPARHDLDRQTPFKELCIVELVETDPLGPDDRLVEVNVLPLVHRTVQIVAAR